MPALPMPAIDHFWAVIPAGGAGTRLWPLSRSSSPKFLHDLTGSGRSLLQETVDRLAPLAEDRVLVVTGAGAPRTPCVEQLPDARPGRGAGRAVAARLDGRDRPGRRDARAPRPRRGDGLVRRRPRDRRPRRVRARPCALAVEVARDGWLVTLGIEPTFPSPAFGYIHLGDAAGRARRARARCGSSSRSRRPRSPRSTSRPARYRWNAGMFVVRPGVLLDLLGRVAPGVRGRAARRSPPTRRGSTSCGRRCRRSRSTTPSPSRPPTPAGSPSCRRLRLGRHRRLRLAGRAARRRRRTRGVDRARRRGAGARASTPPAWWCRGSGRVVAVVGLDDVVVVDTPDALLVTTRARAQEVKQVVAELKEAGRADLTSRRRHRRALTSRRARGSRCRGTSA